MFFIRDDNGSTYELTAKKGLGFEFAKRLPKKIGDLRYEYVDRIRKLIVDDSSMQLITRDGREIAVLVQSVVSQLAPRPTKPRKKHKARTKRKE
jgi:hypothetical protein